MALKFIFKTCVQPYNLYSKQPEAIQWKMRWRFRTQAQARARGLWNMYGYLPRLEPADRRMRSFVDRSKAKMKKTKGLVFFFYFLCFIFQCQWLTNNLLPWTFKSENLEPCLIEQGCWVLFCSQYSYSNFFLMLSFGAMLQKNNIQKLIVCERLGHVFHMPWPLSTT